MELTCSGVFCPRRRAVFARMLHYCSQRSLGLLPNPTPALGAETQRERKASPHLEVIVRDAAVSPAPCHSQVLFI